MKQLERFRVSRRQWAASTILSALLALPISAKADGICPKGGDKLIVTHPAVPDAAPETRLRCGTPVAPDVIEVAPSAPVAPPAASVRIVRVPVVVIKKVFVRARPHYHRQHGLLDFLFHPGR